MPLWVDLAKEYGCSICVCVRRFFCLLSLSQSNDIPHSSPNFPNPDFIFSRFNPNPQVFCLLSIVRWVRALARFQIVFTVNFYYSLLFAFHSAFRSVARSACWRCKCAGYSKEMKTVPRAMAYDKTLNKLSAHCNKYTQSVSTRSIDFYYRTRFICTEKANFYQRIRSYSNRMYLLRLRTMRRIDTYILKCIGFTYRMKISDQSINVRLKLI